MKMATNPILAGVSRAGLVPCVKQVCLSTVEKESSRMFCAKISA